MTTIGAAVVGQRLQAGWSHSLTGNFSSIGGGSRSTNDAPFATIGGGVENTLQSGARSAVISGGEQNIIQTNSVYSNIGGGTGNIIKPGNQASAILGGRWNVIESGLSFSAIAGGAHNSIGAYAASIGGGQMNTNNATFGTLSGGTENVLRSGTDFSAIGGGLRNVIQSNATFAVIPGGLNNTAGGEFSFAAGQRAKAIHPGAFVWADSTSADVASTAANQFVVRASGGARFSGGGNWDVNNTEGDWRVGSDAFRFKIGVAQGGGGNGDVWMRAHGGTGRMFIKTPGGTTFFSDEGQAAGVSLPAGGGSWTSVSDRNAKENFAAVNPRDILEKVAALPVQTWNYRSQDAAIRHIGPTAQEFRSAFAVGESETGITSVDADGVALAAIQGLHELVKEKDTQIKELQETVASLKAAVDTLLERKNEAAQ